MGTVYPFDAGGTSPTSAGEISYDNAVSELSAKNVQGALDEIAGGADAAQAHTDEKLDALEEELSALGEDFTGYREWDIGQLVDIAGALSALGNELSAANEKINGGLQKGNYLINGDFRVCQRGTSQTTGGYGSFDRWFFNLAGVNAVVGRQAANGEIPSPYFCRIQVDAADSGASSVYMQQKIEDVYTVPAGAVTLSFLAKANAAGKILVADMAQHFGTGGPAPLTVGGKAFSLTTEWERYCFTFTNPSLSGKIAGSNSYFSASLWVTGAEAGSGLGGQTGVFDIAQVKLESGSFVTPFAARPIAEELALCRRYFYKIDMPNQWTFVAAGGFNAASGLFVLSLPVAMRAAPKLVTAGEFYAFSDGGNISLTDLRTVGFTGDKITIVGNAANTSNRYGVFGNLTRDAYVLLDAEL